jgi:hypothetical protein
MSYAKMIRWNKRHRKGTRQTVLMHTNRGFTPSRTWMTEDWFPYLEKCKAQGIEAMEIEQYYKSQLR